MTLTSGIRFGFACLLFSHAQAQETKPSDPLTAIATADFCHIPDAPFQVVESKLVAGDGMMPAYFRIHGYVEPQVGFVAWLPVRGWNDKILEFGSGGSGGSLDMPAATFGGPLRKGYACVFSDTGHTGVPWDGIWAFNNLQARVDWGYRSTHVALLASRAIVERFYGHAAKGAYFMGRSTGGRQALIEAERFPSDFNGIIALAPAVSEADTIASLLWNFRAMTDQAGNPILSPEDCQFVHDRVVGKFDGRDGTKDGLIGDPRLLRFDPSELLQKDPKSGRSLNPTQVEAVRKVWGGPRTASGKELYPGCERPLTDLRPIRQFLFGYRNLVENYFRFMAFLPDAGPGWKLADFDFDRDFERMRTIECLYDASNPDLRDFRAAGGKLLVCQGWNDESPPPLKTVDFYETLERVAGGRSAAMEFCRLFMVPGMNHSGRGGDGPAAIDFLSAMEAWVERGLAPDKLIGAHVTTPELQDNVFPLGPEKIAYTRPIYPYPVEAHYLGAGDPKDAANFGPQEP